MKKVVIALLIGLTLQLCGAQQTEQKVSAEKEPLTPRTLQLTATLKQLLVTQTITKRDPNLAHLVDIFNLGNIQLVEAEELLKYLAQQQGAEPLLQKIEIAAIKAQEFFETLATIETELPQQNIVARAHIKMFLDRLQAKVDVAQKQQENELKLAIKQVAQQQKPKKSKWLCCCQTE